MFLLKCGDFNSVIGILLAILLIPVEGFVQTPAKPHLSLQWMFIALQSAWVPPDRDPELPNYETALASIAVFYPSGEFAAGDFWIGRNRDGSTFIMPGEGFAIRKGQWHRNRDQIEVEWTVVYRDKMLPAHTTPEVPVHETWKQEGTVQDRIGARFRAPSGVYKPLNALLNLSTLESLLNDPGR